MTSQYANRVDPKAGFLAALAAMALLNCAPKQVARIPGQFKPSIPASANIPPTPVVANAANSLVPPETNPGTNKPVGPLATRSVPSHRSAHPLSRYTLLVRQEKGEAERIVVHTEEMEGAINKFQATPLHLSCPREMTVRKAESITLTLDDGSGRPGGQTSNIETRFEAKLSSDNADAFDIVQLPSPHGSDSGPWVWRVTPKTPGQRALTAEVIVTASMLGVSQRTAAHKLTQAVLVHAVPDANWNRTAEFGVALAAASAGIFLFWKRLKHPERIA